MATVRTSLMIVVVSLLCGVNTTPLDDYVRQPDSHYKYVLLTEIHEENYTAHVLNMTSQKWMNDEFSSHSIWWHHVYIIVPRQIKVKDTAFLWISDGHNREGRPDLTDKFVAMNIIIAVSTQTVAVVIKQIPNQPIEFKSDPSHNRRSEDNILAWSWREYINNNQQPQALVHLPMTKAVVRAMDTVEEYSQKTRSQVINKFFVAGASKRGWTTWLTAAVDKRVIGMAPFVYDLLNMNQALHHHYKSLGGWTLAFKPYFQANVTQMLGSQNFNQTLKTMDPLVYKDRYTMPVYIVKATGDEFFLPDETRFFYDQLKGPKYLRVIPNCEHTLIGQLSNAILSLRSFYMGVLQGSSFPNMTWTVTSSNLSSRIQVKMDTEPLTVILYYAQTLADGRRDFRLLAKNPHNDDYILHPVIWFKGHVTKKTSLEYDARVKSPLKGWRAYFVEATFKGVNNTVLALSTEVVVVPDTLPFPDCSGTNCKGKLV